MEVKSYRFYYIIQIILFSAD